MKLIANIVVVMFIMSLYSCEGVDEITLFEAGRGDQQCKQNAIEKGTYYEIGTESYLWGGEDSAMHFNITEWTLSLCNLRFGLGRETFNALTEPEYISLDEADLFYPDTTRVLFTRSNNGVKMYPLPILISYETVNEYVDNDPVAIVYCHLADLVTVFSRTICNDTLTFAVSGYTYEHRGLESFLLWDRNSESLWWPIDDIGVSGHFKDQRLDKYDITKWGVLRFDVLKEAYPNALVLKGDQPRKEVSNMSKIRGCD